MNPLPFTWVLHVGACWQTRIQKLARGLISWDWGCWTGWKCTISYRPRYTVFKKASLLLLHIPCMLAGIVSLHYPTSGPLLVGIPSVVLLMATAEDKSENIMTCTEALMASTWMCHIVFSLIFHWPTEVTAICLNFKAERARCICWTSLVSVK